jgi:beta-phosphoglucomutase-like phosphatase (HAD superfamily)
LTESGTTTGQSRAATQRAGTTAREPRAAADRPLRLRRLRLAAVNIDGVLLDDTFSPVIHHFVTSRGGVYTAELERGVFSQNRQAAARVLAAAVPGEMTPDEVLREYFAEREEYLLRQPIGLTPGAVPLLERLRAAGLATVCYGGLSREHFDRHLGAYKALFDPPEYVCTDSIRPGLREIAAIFELPHEQVVFIDDVASVAVEAHRIGAAFIGHPSSFPHGYQAAFMREAGTEHLVESLDAIDDTLLLALDGGL